MSDLEELKHTFDKIGIKYILDEKANETNLTILDDAALKIPGLTFKEGKYHHTFVVSNILLENYVPAELMMLVFQEEGTYRSVCACGYRKETTYFPRICEKCKTVNIKKIKNFSKEREAIIDSTYELIAKKKLFFHLLKHDIIAAFDPSFEHFSLYTRPGDEVKMNFMEKTFEVIKKDDISTNQVKDLKDFFKNAEATDAFIAMISTPEKKEYYDYMFNGIYNYKGKKPSVADILLNTLESNYVDVLIAAGINLKYIDVNHFHKEETQLHRILGVPKAFLPHLQAFLKYRFLDTYDQEVINSANENFGWNFVDEILNLVKEKDIYYQLIGILEAIPELVERYGYQTKHLLRYLTGNIEPKNYKDTLTMLRDYHKMGKDLEMNVERYPKNLKRKHDELVSEYRHFKDKNRRQFFQQAINTKDYQSLAFKSEEYMIRIPKAMGDLTREGSNLHHCVASYISRVTDRECKILFLRKTDAPDKSLVTIEVRGKSVWQAKGSFNRDIDKKERKFLRKWAEENDLRMSL